MNRFATRTSLDTRFASALVLSALFWMSAIALPAPGAAAVSALQTPGALHAAAPATTPPSAHAA